MSRPDVDALLRTFRDDLARAATPDALEEVRRAHTGKKSPIKRAFRELRQVPPEERSEVAKALNDAQQAIEAALDEARQAVEARALQHRLDAEWMDLTLPGIAQRRGMRHPITLVEQQCLAVLRQLGFELVEGPEVESAYYNFDALNIPEHHPARDMQDTFWVSGGLLLRSHTTSVQARVLEAAAKSDGDPLPIRVTCMGRVYRNEAVDATHLAMFHQLEGLWIERGLTFSHLKGVLSFVARALYGQDRKIRFKPKFYPYTEPSVGVDVSCTVCDGVGCEACHETGWVTILGAGMVHPKMFLEFGFDPEQVSGIAFGLGTTRMVAQHYGLSKLRHLYDQDLRVVRALHLGEAA